MPDNMEVYRIWAPDNALWTAWAKPVLFAVEMRISEIQSAPPDVSWVQPGSKNTMIILDLPGKESVVEGLALAQTGFRPVPLFNGVMGPSPKAMLVDTTDIVAELYRGAATLSQLRLPPNAPPVFLLDANRARNASPEPGRYDNRWRVFPQDMPSASFLQKNGIREIIVRGESIQTDLSHILYRYQEQGIRICIRSSTKSGECRLPKPQQFRSLFYRFLVTAGLRRNATGGFGGIIPEAGSGGGIG